HDDQPERDEPDDPAIDLGTLAGDGGHQSILSRSVKRACTRTITGASRPAASVSRTAPGTQEAIASSMGNGPRSARSRNVYITPKSRVSPNTATSGRTYRPRTKIRA